MSDMGALFHCRRPLSTGHAIARDGTKTHREVQIEQSGLENSEAARSAGRVKYLMASHPRMKTDAAHIWLRQAIRETGKTLSNG